MRFNTRKFFTLIVLVALTVGLVPIVGAQDDAPTAEEQALLDQFFGAVQIASEYESLVLTTESSESSQQIAIEDGVEVNNTTELKESSNIMYVTRGDSPSGQYNGTVVYTLTTLDAATSAAFTADGAFTYQGGALSGSAIVTEGTPPIPLPAEPTQIADAENNEFSTFFDTRSFENAVLGVIEEDSIFSSPELVSAHYTSITAGEEELDGETVSTIAITVEGTDLAELLAVAPDTAASAPLFAAMDEGGYAEIIIAFNAEGNPVGVYSALELSITDLPYSAIDPSQPETNTISLILSSSEIQTFSQINEELVPVATPE
jgi:hypothetical protein